MPGKRNHSANRQSRALKTRRRLGVHKKLLFSLAAVCVFFLLLEALLALSGVRPVLYEEDPYVGFSSYVPLFVESTDDAGHAVMMTAPNKLRHFNEQQFPREKTPNVTRIFCLGGSTTYGRPYADVTSFCGWLREFLKAAEPSRTWEVINAGGISYGSYRVAVVAEELAKYDPDLLVIYTGQNEFLERRTYGELVEMPAAARGLGAVLARTRTYAVVERLIDAVGKTQSERCEAMGPSDRTTLPGETKTLLDDSVGPEDYARDQPMPRDKVLAHFRYNLARIVDIARAANAKAMLIVPASNLRHCSPFKSQHRDGLTATEKRRFHVLVDEAVDAQAAGQWDESLDGLDAAAEIDDLYAQLHYLRGQVLFAMHRYPEAKTAFERARDEDVCPLRALAPTAGIVHEVGSSRNVPVVDFEEIIEKPVENLMGGLPHRIPGEDWFLDHVHPTVDGNRRLALAIHQTMVRQGWVRPQPTWDEAAVADVTQRVESQINTELQGLAMRNLGKVLLWCGKYDEADRPSRRAVELVPHDADAQYHRGLVEAHKGNVEQAIVHYEHAVRLQSDYAKAHNNLGAMHEKKQRLHEAAEQYELAVKARPDWAVALKNLGILLINLERRDEAKNHLREVIRLTPKDHEAHYNLGAAFYLDEDWPQAQAAFQQTLKLYPGFGPALARLEEIRGRKTED